MERVDAQVLGENYYKSINTDFDVLSKNNLHRRASTSIARYTRDACLIEDVFGCGLAFRDPVAESAGRLNDSYHEWQRRLEELGVLHPIRLDPRAVSLWAERVAHARRAATERLEAITATFQSVLNGEDALGICRLIATVSTARRAFVEHQSVLEEQLAEFYQGVDTDWAYVGSASTVGSACSSQLSTVLLTSRLPDRYLPRHSI